MEGILSFSTIPLYLGIYLGIAMAVVGFLYAVFVLYAWLFMHTVVTGWTSLILLLAMVGGIQLIVTGIIGLYIGKLFDEVKQRPLYLVRRTVGLESAAARRGLHGVAL